MEEGFDAAGREYPYWDQNIQSLVYRHDGDWMVSVSPMLVNDRVLLTHRTAYPHTWTAGYCYDKSGAAGLAAMAWNPLTDAHPVGFKKSAGDERTRSHAMS